MYAQFLLCRLTLGGERDFSKGPQVATEVCNNSGLNIRWQQRFATTQFYSCKTRQSFHLQNFLPDV